MHRVLCVPLVALVLLAANSAIGASPALPGRLAYSSDRGLNVHNTEIYALSSNGPTVRDLTRNQGFDGGPSISPDGRWIAFWSDRVQGERVVRGLFVMHPDGSGQRLITPPDLSVDGQTPATWSPDSRRLAFSGEEDQRYGVWLVRLDGSGLRLLAENASEPRWEPHGTRVGYDNNSAPGDVHVETLDVETGARKTIAPGYSPAWSPDGRAIAFVNLDVRTGVTDLFVARSDGGDPARITHVDPSTFVVRPVWSPTGRSIAFELASAVYTIRPDGTQMKRLHVGSGPNWSPNGAEIAFVAGRGVRVMRANGTGVRQLLADPNGFVAEAPEWTHDGRRLLVQTATDHTQYDLFVSNADGSGLHRLMHSKQDEFLPAWSPDRRRIAFVRGRRNPSIWVASASGHNPVRLRTGTYPSWSPGGKRIAYENDGSVYTMTDRGSAASRIGPGSMPSWSPDGKSIALMVDKALVVVDLRAQVSQKVAELSCGDPSEGGDTILQQPEWSPDSKTLAVTRLCDHGRWAEGDSWLIDARTGVRRDFSPGQGAASRLAWSPDGLWLAFATGSPYERIVANRVDGTDFRRISVSSGDDRDLDWR
jgi:TolB protein